MDCITSDLLWLPPEEELQKLRKLSAGVSGLKRKEYLNQNSIRSLRSWLKNRLGLDVYFDAVKPHIDHQIVEEGANHSKDKINAIVFPAILYCLTCRIKLESSQQSAKEKFIRTYCSLKEGKDVPETWFVCDSDSIFGSREVNLEDMRTYTNFDIHSFCLGNFVGLNTFVKHLDSMNLTGNEPHKIRPEKVQFMHIKSELNVFFTVGKSPNKQKKRDKETKTRKFFKLVINFASIKKIILCNESKDSFTVYIKYLDSPLLYEGVWRDKKAELGDNEGERSISFSDLSCLNFVRTLDLYEKCPSELKQDFSKNYVLQLQFKTIEYNLLKLFFHVHKHVTVYIAPICTVPSKSKGHFPILDPKFFDSFYAMNCLLSHSHEVFDQLEVRNEVGPFCKYVQKKCAENSKLLANVLLRIYGAMDKGDTVLLFFMLKCFFEDNENGRNDINEKKKLKGGGDVKNNQLEIVDLDFSESLVEVNRAVLTPTHVRFLPHQPMLYNRMLKEGKVDYFLRVTIRDTNNVKLNFTSKKGDRDDAVTFFDNTIKRLILKGIKLGDRTYEYLGASSSQLKSHSFWCYAKDDNLVSASDISKKIGSFDEIQSVPKFMARMGMSFSQSMGHLRVPQEDTNVDDPEEDITGGIVAYLSDDEDEDRSSKKKHLKGKLVDNLSSSSKDRSNSSGSEEEEDERKVICESKDDDNSETESYTFSDGIGRMSSEMAEELFKALKLEEERPSAVQIRYAGCKGMLVLDPTEKRKKIIFRKSMKKLNSEHDSLNILKISKPRSLFLNRSFITILEYKGIKKEIFIRLQKEMVHSSIKSMFHDENATDLLNLNSHLRLNYEELWKCGISFTEDPCFRSMILSIFKQQIYLLKTKARIAVPENQARNMFGVLDETGTLEYNQVFVQYTIMNSKETEILEGPVVVTKNPCIHPGDVRKFMAVNVEGLKHIRDCIVFPAKGRRPHPDEMAGSDLDGDEYSVIWLEDLIFEEGNTAAMNYAVRKVKASEREAPIQVSEQLDHFRNFILNDNVGLLANSHLAWADREHPMSDRCVRIAKKVAKALDFAKTGLTAKMKDFVPKYPDFMEKKHDKNTYISKKALGHLYRMCRSLEIDLGVTTDQMEYKPDEDLICEGWEKYEASAQKMYVQYSKKIVSWMKYYKFDNEGELLSGNFTKSRNVCVEQEDKHHLLDILEHQVANLKETFEKEFFKEFGGKPKNATGFSKEMMQKASAWYMVTYERNVHKNIFGLPWMIYDVLVAMKKNKQKPTSLGESIFVKKASYVETAIDNHVREHMKDCENSDDINDYKYEILDNARTILSKWLHMQKDNVCTDVKHMEQLMDKEFGCLSDRLLTCDGTYLESIWNTSEGKKVFSPGYYVLEALIRVSEIGVSHDPNVVYNDILTEFGRLAWITLIHLACTCNVKYLGLVDSGDEKKTYQAEKNDVISTMQVPLDPYMNEEKKTGIIRFEEDIRKAILNEYKRLKDCMLSWEYGIFKKGKMKINLKITVKGPRHTVDQLQEFFADIAFQDFLDRTIDIAQKHADLKESKYESELASQTNENSVE